MIKVKKNCRLGNRSFKELVQENKKNILNDKQAMERIEKRIEQRYETKKSAS